MPYGASKPGGLSKHTLDRHAAYLGVFRHGLLILSLPGRRLQQDEETRVVYLPA